jgi:hypothetical protein
MAILDAMQKASIRLIGQKPGTFFGAVQSSVFALEITDLVNEVAEDIAQYQDWQKLIKFATINGTGATAYPLPDDYGRQMIFSDMQDTEHWFWGFRRYIDINEFTFAQRRGTIPYPGGWIIFGDQIQFAPVSPAGAVATYPYVTRNWAADTAGTPKNQFSADTDTFALPERLLTLGLVWRWRDQKKLDCTGDQEAFAKAIEEYGAKDTGSRVIRFNRTRRHHYGRIAYSGIAY